MNPINDYNNTLEDLIEAESALADNPECKQYGHAWQELHSGRIRCQRCKYAPHKKMETAR